MSVRPRKLKNGRTRYEVRWREGSRNKSRMFDLRPDAVAYDKKIRRLRQAGELGLELEKRRITVRDLYADWLDRAAPALSAKTQETYGYQLDMRLLPALGDRLVHQLTVRDVEQWIAKMRTDGDGDPTIQKAVTVLSALLSMAVRDGVVQANVAQQARKPRQGRTRTPHLIKPAAVELVRREFVQAGRERDVVLLELLAYAGLRPESEGITLRWGQVRDRSIVVRDTKRKVDRTVVLVDPLRETLAAWRLRRGRPDSDALVVPTASEQPWTEFDWRNWRRRVFKPAAVAAGLPADIRPRDLRGSFVSLLVHEGRSIAEVARQTGHSPEVCLRDYAQVFDEQDPTKRMSAAEIIRAARAAADAVTDAKEETA